MNTRNDLFEKFGEVVKMCRGTALEAKPYLGVKIDGHVLDEYPTFYCPEEYTFLVAILEDKPVFVGAVLYSSLDGNKYVVTSKTPDCLLFNTLTWQPPKKKRTFRINDVVLPCPRLGSERNEVTISGKKDGLEYSYTFSFDERKDSALVINALAALLQSAEAKD